MSLYAISLLLPDDEPVATGLSFLAPDNQVGIASAPVGLVRMVRTSEEENNYAIRRRLRHHYAQ